MVKSRFVKTLKLSDIPPATRPNRKALVEKTEAWPETRDTLEKIKNVGLDPQETKEAPVAETARELQGKVKNPFDTIKHFLRGYLKSYRLENRCRMVIRDSGKRIFFVDPKAELD